MKTFLFSAFLLLFSFSTSAQGVVEAPSSPEKIVQFKNGNLYGFRGFSSEKVYVEPKFEKLEREYSQFMEAQLNGKKGFINGRGETLVPFEFDRIKKPSPSISREKRTPTNHFSWFLAQKDGLWGGVDSIGKRMVPFEWETAQFVNDTIVVLSREGLLRVAGPVGKVYMNEEVDGWSWANPDDFYRTLLIRIKKKDKIGVVDYSGRVVVPVEYARLHWFFGGFICVEDAAYHQIIYNMQGRVIVPLQMSEMMYEGRDLILVVKDKQLGKSGLVDSTGRTVLPFEFAECRIIREDDVFFASQFLKARKLKEKEFAIYTIDGQKLSEPLYKEAFCYNMSPTLVFAQLPDNSWHMLAADGKKKQPDVFNDLTVSGEVIVGSKDNVGKAFYSLDGTQITGFNYTFARGMKNDFQRQEFAQRIGLKDPYALIGEAAKPGVPQLFIDKEGKEWVLPK